MKNILIPTDFSENAWNAIEYALALFEHEECIFHLLNTYTPGIAHSRYLATKVIDDSDEELCSTSANGLKKLVTRIEKKFDNSLHHYKCISSFSLLTDKVKELVEKESIDLILTGTKGASFVEGIFMGSNTVRIIKSVQDCPVLVIPRNFSFKTTTEIAFATDFNRFYSSAELQPLIRMVKMLKTVLRIVHVRKEINGMTELQQFNYNMLRKYLNKVEHTFHVVSKLNSVSKTLETFTTRMDIHLLAMLNYQHSFMERATREHVVKQTAFHTQIPLFIIPEIGMSEKSHSKKALMSSN